MSRIIIASTSEQNRSQLSGLLTASGFPVFRCVSSASELRRSMNACEDGLVLIMGNLPNCSPDDLYLDYGPQVQFLLIGRPAQLEAVESPEIFRLPMPVSGQALIGAVSMLSQFHRLRLPRRNQSEKQLVDEAKKQLMQLHGMTEPEAHHAMQQYCMQHGIKMADYAAELLRAQAGLEE